MNKEIIVALIGAVATILTALISNTSFIPKDRETSGKISKKELIIIVVSFIFGVCIVGFTWLFSESRPVEKKHIVGFYKDRNPQLREYFTDERIDIEIYKDNSVRGTTVSAIEGQDGMMRDKYFNVQGYLSSHHLVLSYLTNEINPRGIGSYILERTGDDYVGYLVVKDPTGIFITPYAAGPKQQIKMDEEFWRKKWPQLMSQPIVNLNLNPDRQK